MCVLFSKNKSTYINVFQMKIKTEGVHWCPLLASLGVGVVWNLPIHVDDNQVSSKHFDEDLPFRDQIFSKIESAGMTINSQKGKTMSSTINIVEWNVSTIPEYLIFFVDACDLWPVQLFHGFNIFFIFRYSSWCHNISQIMLKKVAPLYDLLRKLKELMGWGSGTKLQRHERYMIKEVTLK